MKKVKLLENYISALLDMDLYKSRKFERLLYIKERNKKIFKKVLSFLFRIFILNFITVSTVYLSAGWFKIIEIKINFFLFAIIFQIFVIMLMCLFNFKNIQKDVFIEILKRKK